MINIICLSFTFYASTMNAIRIIILCAKAGTQYACVNVVYIYTALSGGP